MNLVRALLTRFFRRVVQLIFLIFYRLEVTGKEHIPATGGCLLASNHVSFLDPPLVAAACPRTVVFTPRTTLGQSWVYRTLTWFAPTVPLRRGGADHGAARVLIDSLQEGRCIAVFPEETRSATGKLGPVKGGFHMLAARAEVPVVPVYLDGPFEIWPRQRSLPRLRGKIRVRFGPAFSAADKKRREAAPLLQQRWQQLGGILADSGEGEASSVSEASSPAEPKNNEGKLESSS